MSDRAAALREEALLRPGSRDGLESENVSGDDGEGSSTTIDGAGDNKAGSTVTGALGLAARGFRGAAQLVRGVTDDGSSGGSSKFHHH
jgi:hypothetical protein